MNRLPSRRRRDHLLLSGASVLVLVATLAVLNGTWAFLYVRFERVREEQFTQRLETLADWARSELAQALDENLLDFEEIPWLEEVEENIYADLEARLQDFVTREGLERLLIHGVTEDGFPVKLDTAGLLAANEENPLTQVDAPWIEQALKRGEAVAMSEYEVEGVPFMRAHTPLISDSGTLTGLLTVEGRETHFQAREDVRGLVTGTLVLVNGVLVLLGLLAHRAFRRRLRLEEAMDHSDRLQTLGTLAAGMAHEIRNPLGIMRISTELLGEELTRREVSDETSSEMVSDILEEIDRVHDLIGRFLKFARPGEHDQQEPAEIIPTVQHVVRLFQKTAGMAAIRVEIEPGMDGAITPLPAASLQQVLFNVIRNAQEALAEARSSSPIQVSVRRSGEAVRVAVRDEGIGMTPDQVRRADRAFQTTKSEGTGLGLSISKNLLASVQGRLEISSAPGEGTEVCVLLPLMITGDISQETER